MTWLGNDVPWKKHPNPPLQLALEAARQRRWYLKLHTNNNFGKVVCRLTDDDEFCKAIIFLTPDDPESFSIQFRKKIKECPHREADEEGNSVGVAEQLVEQATRLLNAAEKCLDGMIKKAHSLELLEQALLKLDGAEIDLLAEAATLEREGHMLISEAVSESNNLGIILGDPPSPTLSVDGARQRASQALSETSQAGSRDLERIKTLVSEARGRANAIQKRISVEL